MVVERADFSGRVLFALVRFEVGLDSGRQKFAFVHLDTSKPDHAHLREKHNAMAEPRVRGALGGHRASVLVQDQGVRAFALSGFHEVAALALLPFPLLCFPWLWCCSPPSMAKTSAGRASRSPPRGGEDYSSY